MTEGKGAKVDQGLENVQSKQSSFSESKANSHATEERDSASVEPAWF